MKPVVKIYDLHDPQQYEDEREFWRQQSPEYKLLALETLRRRAMKLGSQKDAPENVDGSIRRLRRVLQITERS